VSIHVCVPILGNLPDHRDLGCPVVRGVSLAPASPGALARFRALGGSKQLSGAEATLFLVQIPREAQTIAERRAKGLAETVEIAKRHGAEAESLSASAVLGDERKIILGFVAMLDAALAEDRRMLDDNVVRDAAHLRRHLPQAVGLDLPKLDKALAELGKVEERCAVALGQLSKLKAKLVALADKVDEADVRSNLVALRDQARVDRDLPKVRAELEVGRQLAQEALKRFDDALRLLGEAA
jgi:hypothetical protein